MARHPKFTACCLCSFAESVIGFCRAVKLLTKFIFCPPNKGAASGTKKAAFLFTYLLAV